MVVARAHRDPGQRQPGPPLVVVSKAARCKGCREFVTRVPEYPSARGSPLTPMNPILARLGHSGGLAPGREERLLGAVSLIGREIALENKRFYAEKPVMRPESGKRTRGAPQKAARIPREHRAGAPPEQCSEALSVGAGPVITPPRRHAATGSRCLDLR